MQLLPNEEKVSLLKAPKLFLTNQRIIEDLYSYASVNLKDITIIKTTYYSNNRPAAMGIIGLLLSFALMDSLGNIISYVGIAAFIAGLLYSVSSRRTTLDIYASGGNISVKVNYVDKSTIRNFIYQVEAEMERVKNGLKILD